jgi:hypothetical protein
MHGRRPTPISTKPTPDAKPVDPHGNDNASGSNAIDDDLTGEGWLERERRSADGARRLRSPQVSEPHMLYAGRATAWTVPSPPGEQESRDDPLRAHGKTGPPTPGGKLLSALTKTAGAGLLIVAGILGFGLAAIMAMFSEGLHEPWRSSPTLMLSLGIALLVTCFLAAAGVVRGRRWGVVLGAGVVVLALVVLSGLIRS